MAIVIERGEDEGMPAWLNEVVEVLWWFSVPGGNVTVTIDGENIDGGDASGDDLDGGYASMCRYLTLAIRDG